MAGQTEYQGCDIAVFRQDGTIECYEIEMAVTHHIAQNIRRNIVKIGAEKTIVVMETKEQVTLAIETDVP